MNWNRAIFFEKDYKILVKWRRGVAFHGSRLIQ